MHIYKLTHRKRNIWAFSPAAATAATATTTETNTTSTTTTITTTTTTTFTTTKTTTATTTSTTTTAVTSTYYNESSHGFIVQVIHRITASKKASSIIVINTST